MKRHECKACREPTSEECGALNILCVHCWRNVPVPVRHKVERFYTRGQCENWRLIDRRWFKAVRLAVMYAREGRTAGYGKAA